MTSFYVDCERGSVRRVERALGSRRGVSALQERGPNERTPLHAACEGGHTAIADALLRRGRGLIDVLDAHSRSALHVASEAGRLQCVVLLLDASASPDLVDVQGCTALMRACIGGHTELVDVLLRRRAQPNLIDNAGMTALFRSLVEGNAGCVASLLRAGAALQPAAPGVKLLAGALKSAERRGHAECISLVRAAKGEHARGLVGKRVRVVVGTPLLQQACRRPMMREAARVLSGADED